MNDAQPTENPASILVQRDARGIATLTFNRPARSNAMNQAMIDDCAQALRDLEADASVRVVVLRANGRHFCAGADVGGDAPAAHASTPPLTLTGLCDRIDRLSRPVIGLVHGGCVGGGVAIAACCDIVLATEEAFFAITEVRLGMAPAPLMPYFVRALGNRAARRYVLSAERMPASEALRLGFVHRVAGAADLESALAEIADALLLGAPGALAASKALIASVDGQRIEQGLLDHLEAELEVARHGDEAREGVASFREKRRPRWYLPAD